MVRLIVAMDEKGGIGIGNKMPWHEPEDMKHFKNTTMGDVVLMGGNTYRSIGKALLGRDNVVLSRTLQCDDATVVRNIEETLKIIKEKSLEKEIFVMGGKDIYTLMLPYVNQLIITRIKGVYECDTYMPEIDYTEFERSITVKRMKEDCSFFTVERLQRTKNIIEL